MRILFEEYSYNKVTLEDKDHLNCSVEDNFDELMYCVSANTIKFTCVGYCYNSAMDDGVFILPKVFLNKNGNDNSVRVFALPKVGQDEEIDFETGFAPIDLVRYVPPKNPNANEQRLNELMPFVYSISIWIYQSIQRYSNTFGDGNILNENLQRVVTTPGEATETWLDTIISLVNFYKKHRTLVTFITINKHSGARKVNWQKTVSSKTPFLQHDTPIYMNVVNKSKSINYDEELIVLFLSTLNYLHGTYYFEKFDSTGYELLSKNDIQRLIDTGKGLRKLRSIRHKYFSDELVQLWNLMYLFFKQRHEAKSKKRNPERTIVKKYDRVFENMIDNLIGEDLPKALRYMKNQTDGKNIDHIYRDNSFTDDKEIFFIGDSKYYKETSELGKNAIAKQFTYAKNVIQYYMNIFNNGKDIDKQYEEEEQKLVERMRYRDELTEGYNITPNFFIEGRIQPKYIKKDNWGRAFKENDLNPDSEQESQMKNYQFKNRLFDRDTLILQNFNINFLYVLATYVRNHSNESEVRMLKGKLRTELLTNLNAKYTFYLLTPKNYGDSIEELVENNFKWINGKIFRPYDDRNIIVLAQDTGEQLSDKVKEWRDNNFNFVEYKLGENPIGKLSNIWYSKLKNPIFKAAADGKFQPNELKCTIYIVGCYKNQEHLNWIENNSKYNVRVGDRNGAVKEEDLVKGAKYLLLYDFETKTNLKLYSIQSFSKKTKQEMQQLCYPNPQGDYTVYDIQIESYSKEIMQLLSDNFVEIIAKSNPAGAPVYISQEELEKL